MRRTHVPMSHIQSFALFDQPSLMQMMKQYAKILVDNSYTIRALASEDTNKKVFSIVFGVIQNNPIFYCL